MDDDRREAPRQALTCDIEFAVDAHGVLEAHGVDVSEVGVGFKSDQPLEMALKFQVEGRDIVRRARLVRVSQSEDGSYSFGLTFLQD
jgi:hypothetical protein